MCERNYGGAGLPVEEEGVRERGADRRATGPRPEQPAGLPAPHGDRGAGRDGGADLARARRGRAGALARPRPILEGCP